MDLSTFVVDFQGFKQQHSVNRFIFKEVAIISLEEDSIPTVFHFQSPTRWLDLSEEDKCCNRWLELNYHGIRYSSGHIAYTRLEETLNFALKDAAKILVKGVEKKKWLEELLPHK